MTETMRAMLLTGHGGLERYSWREDWPVPQPGSGDVLIRVGAAGLNNTDVNTRAGWYAKSVTGATDGDAAQAVEEGDAGGWSNALTFPRIQGADVVGEVVALGEGANPMLIGRRVLVDCTLRDALNPMDRASAGYLGSERDGGFAEFCAVPAWNAHPIESPLSDAELATFPCSWSTAEGMLDRAAVEADDSVLITGASGGVGSALIQLAKRRGARVVALASAGKHAALSDLGADALLDRNPGDLAEALQAAIGQPTVTVVADIVGGPMFPRLIEALARGGRYVASGAIAGPIVDLDLRTLYLHDLTLHGSTITAPHVFPNLVGHISRGEVRPMLAATYPLSDLKEAQQAFIDKRHVGNIVVVP